MHKERNRHREETQTHGERERERVGRDRGLQHRNSGRIISKDEFIHRYMDGWRE